MSSHLLRLLHLHRIGPSLLRRFEEMRALARQRHDLARLDDHLLDDVGLARPEAAAEAARVPWDAPAHWHRPNQQSRQQVRKSLNCGG
ncbi:DUF1127 domain-containing protein [Palleronia sp. LCG004]|uniref:DUF1127 domain-containing protein n=1 Tax=Palleronia sp. LCG004 TaxID=3079304 RepID=UPI002942F92F|nr:DUF1127 domain-containing protein [Palleronia sp. LCG004]WOI56264.1 DUF1127 domain-containing protein [Palleronia sp. LCG004]